MILPDINLLLYANNPVAPEHKVARNWLDGVLTGGELVGFCWPVLCGFLRIITSPRAFLDPLSMQEAIAIVDDWVGRTPVIILGPTERHWIILSHVLSDAKVSGPMTSDAEIAAYAEEHGAVVYTADRGFLRFAGLRVCNPLVS